MSVSQIFIAAFLLFQASNLWAAGPVLFILERSTNKNEVIYEANVTSTGFTEAQPIHPYWKMIEKGGKTEELNGIEKSEAYGVTISEFSPRQVTFTLAAMPKLPIVARISDKKGAVPHAYMSLNGSDVDLKHLFLHLAEGGLTPRLTLVDLTGKQGGHPVNFKLYIEKDDQIRVERAPRASADAPSDDETERL